MNDIVKHVKQGGGLHKCLNSHKMIPQKQVSNTKITNNKKNTKNNNNQKQTIFLDSWE